MEPGLTGSASPFRRPKTNNGVDYYLQKSPVLQMMNSVLSANTFRSDALVIGPLIEVIIQHHWPQSVALWFVKPLKPTK